MKKLLRYCGLVAIAGAVLYLPNCDDDPTGPAPYTGPWKIVPCPDLERLHYLTGVYFIKPGLGYCVGGPYILKWDGFSWKEDYELIPTPPYDLASCYDVYFLNANDGWVAGGEGTASEGNLVILHWDGKGWDRVKQDLRMGYLYCIFFLDEKHGWVGGDGIAKWDGSRWVFEKSIYGVTDIYINSPTDGWAVSKSSERIYHYDGTTWTRVHDDPWGIELRSIFFNSADHGWAGGCGTISEAQSCLMEYKNGKWSYSQLPDRRSGINAIHFSSPTNGWAVEQNTFRWDGERWWYVKKPPPETHVGTLTDVFTLNKTDAWAVGYGRTILHYEP